MQTVSLFLDCFVTSVLAGIFMYNASQTVSENNSCHWPVFKIHRQKTTHAAFLSSVSYSDSGNPSATEVPVSLEFSGS